MQGATNVPLAWAMHTYTDPLIGHTPPPPPPPPLHCGDWVQLIPIALPVLGMGTLPLVTVVSTFPTFGPLESNPPILPTPSQQYYLPFLWAQVRTSSTATAQSWSVPAKVVKHILELEFLDMAKLIPDTWSQPEEEQKCCHQRCSHCRGPITILLRVECYSAILSSKYLDKMPDLVAYQKTIVWAQQSFIGEGWVTYDTCYRCKAALTKTLNWSQVNFTMYNEGQQEHYCASSTALVNTTPPLHVW